MNITKRLKLEKNDGYYFPLFNLKGLRSSITPYFGGDLKLDQHHYALEPTTEVDLYHNISGRNVIFDVNDQLYFLNGQTEHQQQDELFYETGLLYQKVERSNRLFKLITTSYIPTDDCVELHEIKFINHANQKLEVGVTTAVPLYARSADNLRDHRHVTSLLNRIETVEKGIVVHPTLSFDERGHQLNDTIYSLFADSKDLQVKGYIPVLDDFIHGGSLHFPKGLSNIVPEKTQVDGYEAIGAVQFEKVILNPKESLTLYFSIGIHKDLKSALNTTSYLNTKSFEEGLKKTQSFFENYLSGLTFRFHDEETSKQLSWVGLQPMLRRYFGNSYLPHHDYGHGGRGWRDLWQDLLALIMMNDPSVIDLLFNNFLGVRIDGSNATIIGDQPGEFKADRNMITRVWSDHGAWPLLTVKLYIDETGDLDILLKKQGYFMDQFTHYTKKTRPKTKTNLQTDLEGNPYYGTILEHLLLQNLVGHHNIGAHGFVRLEDADWNDGLDMAHKKGETIAFTHMYANNLRTLAYLIEEIKDEKITLFSALKSLLIERADLNHFFDEVEIFSGKTVEIEKKDLVKALNELADHRIKKLQKEAFKKNKFQSYYDNDGHDADTEETISLTGQAMALLSKTASPAQSALLASTTRNLLYDIHMGGYKLNSNYHQIRTNMGRAYGFAYGHKENGAAFSHMAVMYAYGLYQYDLISYGHEAVMTLLKQAQHPNAKVWVGIPEYFNDRGIGMYPYLTGSASWMLLLLRTMVFGIEMNLGKLYLNPRLKKEDFIEGKVSIQTYLFNKLRTITYYNPNQLEYGFYHIQKMLVNGKEVAQGITSLNGDIEVYLDEVL